MKILAFLKREVGYESDGCRSRSRRRSPSAGERNHVSFADDDYVGSGVVDSIDILGVATVFHCSNVSGNEATVRFMVLNSAGGFVAASTISLGHGATRTAVTHPNSTFFGPEGFTEDVNLATGFVGQGIVNIESTESGVFCNAMVLDDDDHNDGFTLLLERVNPHPGTDGVLRAPFLSFPHLTTIYFGAGVLDNGGAEPGAVTTAVNCSNVSGVTASVRFAVFNPDGGFISEVTRQLSHGETRTVVTGVNGTYPGADSWVARPLLQGLVLIESTNSGVICTAMYTTAADHGEGIAIPLVRVNSG